MNEVLKSGLAERDNVFKIHVIAQGFGLLDALAIKKNKEAANIYRTLILSLLDNYKDKNDKSVSSMLL